MKYKAVVCMLDGAMWHGTVEAAFRDQDIGTTPGEIFGQDRQLYFESSDGERCGVFGVDSVKAIYLGTDIEPGDEVSPRFFDAAPIPPSLWVRVTFVDGEVVEGMIANSWSAFNGTLLELNLPIEPSDQRRVLIPRSSIGALQVITTR